MSEHPDRLTLSEAAKRLGLNPATVRRWIKAGKLPATLERTDRGETYFINPDDLEAITQGSRSAPRTERPRPPALSEDLAAIKDAQNAILDQMRANSEAQEQRIRSLEAELHDTRAQLSQFQDQMMKALPAPAKPSSSWLARRLKR
jgi:excisionase family DNA binding protein